MFKFPDAAHTVLHFNHLRYNHNHLSRAELQLRLFWLKSLKTKLDADFFLGKSKITRLVLSKDFFAVVNWTK